jgi:chemotaxis protein CheC
MAVSAEIKTAGVLSSFHTAARSGVKKACQAVSAMSASALRLYVISAGVAPTARLAEIAGDPEDLVVGVYITVSGDIPGHALLVFPYQSALLLTDILLGRPPGSTAHLDEMEQSVIQELGNIVTSSYLTALSDFYRCTLMPSPPGLAVDMAAAVIDSVLLNTGRFDEDTINIVTKFTGAQRSLRGFFLYIPEIATS